MGGDSLASKRGIQSRFFVSNFVSFKLLQRFPKSVVERMGASRRVTRHGTVGGSLSSESSPIVDHFFEETCSFCRVSPFLLMNTSFICASYCSWSRLVEHSFIRKEEGAIGGITGRQEEELRSLRKLIILSVLHSPPPCFAKKSSRSIYMSDIGRERRLKRGALGRETIQ